MYTISILGEFFPKFRLDFHFCRVWDSYICVCHRREYICVRAGKKLKIISLFSVVLFFNYFSGVLRVSYV